MSRQARIQRILTEALAPTDLEILDESHHHAGHSGARPGGETHYRVKIVAAAFTGKSRIARHRLVMDPLKAEFDSGLHALAVEARTPEEAGRE